MPRSGAVRPFVRSEVIRPLTADRTLVPKSDDPHHYKVLSDADQTHRNDLFAARTSPRANQEAPLRSIALAGHAPAAINLNQPGSYLNWNIFTISVANLVLIAVMVAIFGAALLLPFPGRHSRGEPEQGHVPIVRKDSSTKASHTPLAMCPANSSSTTNGSR